MRRLRERGSEDPNLLLGLNAPDDAAVYRMNDDLALVQTVDFFTPIVDEAYSWGAIAAANAMSDVYAMGGKPLLGLNLVGWPKEGLSFDLLAEVMEGAADKMAEAGALVVGGHTIDDAEPKYGLAITGTVDPERIVTASGAEAGMDLVLTKPLGMGIVSTAIKKGKAGVTVIEAASQSMEKLNARAAEAMVSHGAAAATDVTGFGFLGHLHHLLEYSGVAAEIDSTSVPFLDGVEQLAADGLVPGGTRRNEDYFQQWVTFDDSVDEHRRVMLFDAQTSGGLLIAISNEASSDLVAALGAASEVAEVVGRTTDGSPGAILVR